MQNPARIPDLVNRERFIKRVLANGGVSFVAGSDGWACVPFRHDASREVVLFWSSRKEAEKWAPVVATDPSVHDIALDTLLGEVLGMLASRRCLIGIDWSSDPTDPIMDATDLANRLRRERGEQFVATVRASQTVWVLESASGPATLPSVRVPGRECLPVWTTREAAVANIGGAWSVKRPIGVSLAVFADRYLPFLDQRGWLVGPEPLALAGTTELTPAELSMRVFPSATLKRLRAV